MYLQVYYSITFTLKGRSFRFWEKLFPFLSESHF